MGVGANALTHVLACSPPEGSLARVLWIINLLESCLGGIRSVP
jgi:hypothetical protein